MSDDDDVVAGAKRGDPDAWRELYRAHAGRLVVWLSTRAGVDSAVSAEDLAAETWLTASAKIGEFSGDAHDFGGWLFGIARNMAANSRRRGTRRRTDPVESVPEQIGTGDLDHALPDLDRVRAILSQLSPREHDVLACLEVVGMDIAQTARALGLTSVAVRVARHRALSRLRRNIEESDVGSGEIPTTTFPETAVLD